MAVVATCFILLINLFNFFMQKKCDYILGSIVSLFSNKAFLIA